MTALRSLKATLSHLSVNKDINNMETLLKTNKFIVFNEEKHICVFDKQERSIYKYKGKRARHIQYCIDRLSYFYKEPISDAFLVCESFEDAINSAIQKAHWQQYSLLMKEF